MLVGNRGTVGAQFREQVSSLWRGPANIHGFVLGGRSYRQGWATAQTLTEPVNLVCVQPHYYRVWQVEPCQRFGEASKRS